MTLTEKLLFGVLIFPTLAIIVWIVYVRREVKAEEKQKIH